MNDNVANVTQISFVTPSGRVIDPKQRVALKVQAALSFEGKSIARAAPQTSELSSTFQRASSQGSRERFATWGRLSRKER